MTKRAYAEAYRTFTWDDSFRALDWTPMGDVNLGRTILDRHRHTGQVAVRWWGRTGTSRSYTFEELARFSAQFANILRTRGIGKGDRVAGFLPRVPETLIAMLGTWKAGAIYVPIFTGFGPDAIEFRIAHSGAKLICTHWEYRSRVPVLAGTTIVTVAGPDGVRPDDLDFWEDLHRQPETTELAVCRRDEPAVLLYTSGSTGPPKGVTIANNFLLAVLPYMTYGLGLRSDDVFWPTGDPGWGYGLVCYTVALAMGVAVVSHEAAPAPEFCLARLRDLGVTNLATTPTLLRGIMALGEAGVRSFQTRLRSVSSCGEPLNAEVVAFFQRLWNVTPMDQYGSSELGLPIGNFNALEMDVKPGSMGVPFPGCRIAVVDDEGREVEADTVGHIAMWPNSVGYYSLGYWEDAVRTAELYRGGWMTIGDLARRDSDGYFWFEGRADDVIKSAGYRIGPFEVESAILHHPAVAEAAVVGKPDPLRGQIVKAYLVLKPGVAPSSTVADEVVEIVKTRVGKHQYPREVEIVEQLPKTETGKIQRLLLRQR